jgi:K+-sensing histidine kinase KdpD
VQDDGPGIADDEQPHVFDRFKRASNGDNGSRRGSGLGLAIARQIVESHEGRIALFSKLGEGSTFIIWLPDRAVGDGPERAAAPPTECPRPRRAHTVGGPDARNLDYMKQLF